MPTVTLLLRGDQIGRYTGFSGRGNSAGRVVTVNGVQAVGPPDQIYTVIVEQVNTGVTEYQNGQFITIRDSGGNVIVPRTGVQPDIEQGLGTGDEHLILSGQPFLIDIGGVPTGPATVTYSSADEAASAGGDDDGRLDFEDFPCFAPGTFIATPGGHVDVAQLGVNDLVGSRDHGSVPAIWTGRRVLDLSPRESGKPIQIKRGSFGRQRPWADLILSTDHRILVRDPSCDLLFGAGEVLAPSKGRAEVLSLCPKLRHMSVSIAYPSARRILTVREAQSLADVLLVRKQLIGESPVTNTKRDLRVVM